MKLQTLSALLHINLDCKPDTVAVTGTLACPLPTHLLVLSVFHTNLLLVHIIRILEGVHVLDFLQHLTWDDPMIFRK